jgi:hypothetical protein
VQGLPHRCGGCPKSQREEVKGKEEKEREGFEKGKRNR